MKIKTPKKIVWILLALSTALFITLLVINSNIKSYVDQNENISTGDAEEIKLDTGIVSEEGIKAVVGDLAEEQTKEPDKILVEENKTTYNISNNVENKTETQQSEPAKKTQKSGGGQTNTGQETTQTNGGGQTDTEQEKTEMVDEVVQPPQQNFLDWNGDGIKDLLRQEIDGNWYVFPNYGTNENPIYNESYPYNETS